MGWYCKKFGLQGRSDLVAFYRDRDRVLEVGPGSGFNTRFIAEQCRGEVYALDISDAAFTTFENTHDLPNCTVVQADLMEAPFRDSFFDLIIADGVLHHTPDTQAAVRALYRKVRPGASSSSISTERWGRHGNSVIRIYAATSQRFHRRSATRRVKEPLSSDGN